MSKQVKTTWIIFIIMIVSIIFHNFFYAIFKFEEIIFFFLGIGGFFALIGYSLYLGIKYLIKKKPKDLFHIGWIGIILAIFFIIIGANNPILYILPLYFLLFFISKK